MRMGSDFVFVLMIYIRNSTQEVTVIYAITVTLIFENFSFRCDCTAIKKILLRAVFLEGFSFVILLDIGENKLRKLIYVGRVNLRVFDGWDNLGISGCII